MMEEEKTGAVINVEQNGLSKIGRVPLSPEKQVAIDKQYLAAPIKSNVDKFQLVPEFLKVRGLVKQHLDSFDYFVKVGIKKIVRANQRIQATSDPGLFLRYKDVRIGKPVDSEDKPVTPHMCRQANLTYAAPIIADIEYIKVEDGVKNLCPKTVKMGKMPVMLRSCCCRLYKKDEDELAKLGECPLDPGGYIIINGNEKVLLMQEQLAKNRIIIDIDKKKRLCASVQSSTATHQSKTIVVMDKDKIYVSLNQFKTQVPIMIVMKAMGMETDQEVAQMIGRNPRYLDLLRPSIEECASLGVHTKKQALDFMKKKVTLTWVFLKARNNFRAKCIYTAVMMRRMMDAIFNKDAMDDKDYVGNKRVELSGQLISLLFEDLFKTTNKEIVARIDKHLKNTTGSQTFDFYLSSHIESDKIITDGLERTLSTGNFKITRFRMDRKGMTQVLSRLSYIGTVGMMTRVSPQFEKSMKVSGPRALQPSQWGMLCPCDTPEGEACGLVKNLALMTHVTTDDDDNPLIYLCLCLGVQDLEYLSGEELHTPNSYLIMLNGLILGKHSKPQQFANAMRKLRRAGIIGEFVSVFVNEKQHCVYIASDGGRVCRPLIIVDNGKSRISESHMKKLSDGALTFDDFLCDGLIEYLDVNEQNNALIALYEADITKETTHVEIEPFTILGVVAGLIPFPHHNQSPRNTYQCAMGKQAMGNISYNQLRRMDHILLLVYPQRPLLTTRTIQLVGYDKLGAGQNATVAVMSYSGYDIEDAIVMNKSSLDRGFGRCIVMKKIAGVFQNHGGVMDKTGILEKGKSHILDYDGIASPGMRVKCNDTIFVKRVPKESKDPKANNLARLPDSAYRPISMAYKDGHEGETCVVDKVALFTSSRDGNKNVKFVIRHHRRPELGDKFSSRHGQKGVCGLIVQQEDFPFSERGICPDLIMNPHGFPSRMTIGKMIELLGGKAGVSCGRFHYGSAFGEPSGHADKVEVISETLVEHGFNYSGKDFIYSGITGCPLQAYIFMGPIYYQKLKHMVVDKMHARGNGPRTLMTRQPTEGRARNGGLRVGEMERDCLIAYGASNLIYERLMLSSDPFEIKVCRVCGLLGYFDYKLKTGLCSTCKNGDNISSLKLPYACKLLFQELHSMNIVPRLRLTES
ncbi:hypothetical protein QQ045_011486 [Rhodiola kirilowii]